MQSSRPGGSTIGWISPIPPPAVAARTPGPLPFPLESGASVYASAAAALGAGLEAVGLEAGSAVLVPDFSQGWEVTALDDAGLEPVRYPLTGWEPDADVLGDLVGDRVRALLLVHHFGWPADGPRWRRWCDERELILVEDAAWAWLGDRAGSPVGSHGHVAAFAPGVTLGLDRGGVVRVEGARAESSAPELDRGALAAAAARTLAGAVANRLRPPGPAQGLGEGQPGAELGVAATASIWRLDARGVAAARRAHYRVLAHELGDLVAPGFAQLPTGAVPLVLPLAPPDSEAMARRLAAARVRTWPLWPGARRELVGLPVHQGLDPGDVERIVTACAPPPRPRPSLERVTDMEAAREDWEELGARSGNLFATWEWCSAWWRHLGGEAELVLLRARRADGSPLALIPLVRSRRGPLRILRFLGHGMSDQLGPVCAPEDLPAAVEALRDALAGLVGPWDMLLAEQLPGEPGVEAMLGATVVKREASPFLVTDGRDWEGLLASRSRNFRQQVRKWERRVERDFELEYRLSADPDRLDADLDTFFALHAARWEDESTWLSGAGEQFNREVAHAALARDWLRLWMVYLDGRPVAGWYTFQYADALWAYQTARDPDFEEQRVGTLALIQSVRSSLDEGVAEYKLLRGDQGYKTRFAPSDHGLTTAALARGPAGRAALAAGRGARGLPPAVRGRVAGLLG